MGVNNVRLQVPDGADAARIVTPPQIVDYANTQMLLIQSVEGTYRFW